MSEEEWAAIMKLQAYRSAAEEMVKDPQRRDALILKVPGNDGAMENLPYRALVELLQEFQDAEDDPECFAADHPCRRFISYPVDEVAERFLFDYFLRELAAPGSVSHQIYVDTIAERQTAGPRWELRAAGDRSTFESGEAFHETLDDGTNINSSIVFGAVLRDVRGLSAVTAHSLFWRGFAEFVPAVMLGRSRTLAELVALYPLFEFTFRRGASGSKSCDVLFFG